MRGRGQGRPQNVRQLRTPPAPGGTVTPPDPVPPSLQMEDGSYLLLEDGSRLLLE